MRRSQHRIRTRIVGVNVPTSERLVTGIAGGLLLAYGLRRPSGIAAGSVGLGAIALVRALAGRCPAYRARAIRKGIQIRKAVTIQCTPRDVYELWRDPTNLPTFMRQLTSVTDEGNGITRWVIHERGRDLTFRARIVEDTPDRRLRWQSLPGGDLAIEGTLELRELSYDRGTEVEVKLHYFPPGGLVVASALYSFLRRLARAQLGVELARMRQLLETGEIAIGSRRLEQIEAEDRHVPEGSELQAERTAPGATAQASAWPTATGDVR